MTDDSETNAEPSDSSNGPADLDVPADPPDPAETDHVLAPEDLQYPTVSIPDGRVSPEGVSGHRDLDAEEMLDWLDALSGAVTSHDIAVEGPDRRATFGIAPATVDLSFDPDEDHRGRLEVTLSFEAKALTYEPASARPTGARGGRGFVPLEMLTTDREPSSFRCYNWIDDPAAGIEESDRESMDGDDGTDGDD